MNKWLNNQEQVGYDVTMCVRLEPRVKLQHLDTVLSSVIMSSSCLCCIVGGISIILHASKIACEFETLEKWGLETKTNLQYYNKSVCVWWNESTWQHICSRGAPVSGISPVWFNECFYRVVYNWKRFQYGKLVCFSVSLSKLAC